MKFKIIKYENMKKEGLARGERKVSNVKYPGEKKGGEENMKYET